MRCNWKLLIFLGIKTTTCLQINWGRSAAGWSRSAYVLTIVSEVVCYFATSVHAANKGHIVKRDAGCGSGSYLDIGPCPAGRERTRVRHVPPHPITMEFTLVYCHVMTMSIALALVFIQPVKLPASSVTEWFGTFVVFCCSRKWFITITLHYSLCTKPSTYIGIMLVWNGLENCNKLWATISEHISWSPRL